MNEWQRNQFRTDQRDILTPVMLAFAGTAAMLIIVLCLMARLGGYYQ